MLVNTGLLYPYKLPPVQTADPALFNTARNLGIAAPRRRQPLGMHSCLKGMTLSRAKTAIRQNFCAVGVVTKASSTTIAAGSVISTKLVAMSLSIFVGRRH